MTDLDADAFCAFFEAAWGHPPFDWQRRLAAQVLSAQQAGTAGAACWPQCIALPTAAGKTACIDIAVFALAAQAGRLALRQPLPAPRRIFFVVDRRIIVDEAQRRAQQLAASLAAAQDGILREVANRLRAIADGPLPLTVQSLRGGQLRSDDWAANPLQPSVIASTVDQVGSRLLFRGYGVSSRMWPVHAGLVGNDALILLDEAHCAQPMLETLQAVRRYRGWSEQALPTPFELCVLSATPPAGLDPVFRDESPQTRDPTHPLGRRLLATKPARLVLADKAKGRDAARVRAELAQELTRQALTLLQQPVAGLQGAPALAVFCNRVDTARRAHALMQVEGLEAHLLTGRMRPIDRDDAILAALAPLAAGQAVGRQLQRPTVVVATQTLEVGADLDFDLLVSECASLDALRQRLGRLNRSGRAIGARAAIVAGAGQVEDDTNDPVYGTGLRATWQALRGWANADRELDMGVAGLAANLPTGEALAALCAPIQHAPVLLPAHLDALVQTAPPPEPSPDVGLFLHGVRSGPADVQVCWRADLDPDDLLRGLDSLLRCPPSAPECVAVPFLQLRGWLDGAEPGQASDVEAQEEAGTTEPTGVLRQGLRWRGREHSEVLSGGVGLRPGDLVVLPAQADGLDQLLATSAPAVADWGDRAHAAVRRDAVLRLHPQVMAAWPGAASREPLDALVSGGAAAWDEDPVAFGEALRESLALWQASLSDPAWQWLRDIVARASRLRRLDRWVTPHPCGGWIIEVPRSKPVSAAASAVEAATHAFFSDEDDAASSGHVQSLLVQPMGDGRSHLQGVGELARAHARLGGLDDAWVDVLGMAGDAHDLGKADPRFQALLRNGLPWLGGPLLAKSPEMPQGGEANDAARRRAGYPVGGRHELLSVRLLESCPQALPTDPALREVVLHLVESHHGYCRPFAPVVLDEAPLQVRVEAQGRQFAASSDTGLHRLDAGPADRFWRLTRRHGWWAVAWLEGLLRLADHRRSAWEKVAGEVRR